MLYISGPAAADAVTGVNDYTFRSGRQSLQDVATAGSFLEGEDQSVLVFAQGNAFGQGNLADVDVDVDVALADPATGAILVGPATGELLVRGPGRFAGYFRDPVATKAAWRGGWLATGDVAARGEDGYLRIVDRLKNIYILGGENVAPAEVEQVLRRHPGVADVAVVGVPDARWGEVGVALVVPRHGVSGRRGGARPARA